MKKKAKTVLTILIIPYLLIFFNASAQEKKKTKKLLPPIEDETGLIWDYIDPGLPPAKDKKGSSEIRVEAEKLEKGSPPKEEELPSTPPAAVKEKTEGKDNKTEKKEKPVYVKLDFSNVPLIDLVKSYSQITGENFIFGTKIEGEAQIVSKGKMTLDEARDLLEIALGMGGYTILWGEPRGVRFNKIIRKDRAINDGDVPVVGD